MEPIFYRESQDVPNCLGCDVNLFVGPEGEKTSVRHRRERTALQICQGCTFLKACYQWALDNHAVGVWGGTTDTDREFARRKINEQSNPDKIPHAQLARMERVREAWALFQQGADTYAIADHFGISRSTAGEYLRTYRKVYGDDPNQDETPATKKVFRARG